MLKERLFNLITSLFIGVLVVYLHNTPPKIIIKYPSIDKLTNVKFIDE